MRIFPETEVPPNAGPTDALFDVVELMTKDDMPSTEGKYGTMSESLQQPEAAFLPLDPGDTFTIPDQNEDDEDEDLQNKCVAATFDVPAFGGLELTDIHVFTHDPVAPQSFGEWDPNILVPDESSSLPQLNACQQSHQFRTQGACWI